MVIVTFFTSKKMNALKVYGHNQFCSSFKEFQNCFSNPTKTKLPCIVIYNRETQLQTNLQNRLNYLQHCLKQNLVEKKSVS